MAHVERRRSQRKKIQVLVSSPTGEDLGRVCDLAQQGMQLLHQVPLAVGDTLAFKLEVPRRLSPSPLALQAVCRWTSEDPERGQRRSGLQFVDLQPEAQEVLRRLLEHYVSDLSWSMDQEVHQLVVQLRGSIDIDAWFPELASQIKHPVCFDLSEIKRINSEGVRVWKRFLKTIEPTGPHRFRRCSPSFVAQLNMIANLHVPDSIDSVMAPFFCEKCGKEHVIEVATTSATLPTLPRVICDGCGAEAVFDDVFDRYFSFVGPQR